MILALPKTRDDFKDYVLRRLGAPVININIDDLQVEDRIDDALQFWQDYHFRGSEKIYQAHQVTDEDKVNKYVALPDEVKSITRMLSIGTALGSTSLFSLNYQFAQSDMLQSVLSSGSLVPLWMALTHLEFVQQILVGGQPIRFNMHMNRVSVDMDWNRINTGDYIVFEGYRSLNAEEFPDIWSDKWLLEYTTELVKKQWGSHLKKFGNMSMAGGMTFNGQVIYDEAETRIRDMEHEMINKYSGPIEMFVG